MNQQQSIKKRAYTSKQMGDACEMLVSAELTLAGIPAIKVPDNWPSYDIVAQPVGKRLQRISVKSRTYKKGAAFMEYHKDDIFDWLALVILPSEDETRRRIFIAPRKFTDKTARKNKPTTKTADKRYWSIQEVPEIFKKYENNFTLKK